MPEVRRALPIGFRTSVLDKSAAAISGRALNLQLALKIDLAASADQRAH